MDPFSFIWFLRCSSAGLFIGTCGAHLFEPDFRVKWWNFENFSHSLLHSAQPPRHSHQSPPNCDESRQLFGRLLIKLFTENFFGCSIGRLSGSGGTLHSGWESRIGGWIFKLFERFSTTFSNRKFINFYTILNSIKRALTSSYTNHHQVRSRARTNFILGQKLTKHRFGDQKAAHSPALSLSSLYHVLNLGSCVVNDVQRPSGQTPYRRHKFRCTHCGGRSAGASRRYTTVSVR